MDLTSRKDQYFYCHGLSTNAAIISEIFLRVIDYPVKTSNLSGISESCILRSLCAQCHSEFLVPGITQYITLEHCPCHLVCITKCNAPYGTLGGVILYVVSDVPGSKSVRLCIN